MGELRTRKPTGKPPWPVVLLAGAEKAGKSYAAAQASASEHIGRTFWIGVGEDDPDEYGALPGARFEIVEHEGTYRSILDVAVAVTEQPTDNGRPNLLVVDSMTRLWDLLCDEAQETANRRAARKAERQRRPAPEDDVTIGMDLWNTAKGRWQNIIEALREHAGPVVVTARLETVNVVEGGEPTGEKIQKVKAEKGLPYDVGAIVELPKLGEAYLTGVRSLRFKPGDDGRVAYQPFTLDRLWGDLGLLEPGATGARHHGRINAAESADRNEEAAEQRQQQRAGARAPQTAEELHEQTKRAVWKEAQRIGWDADVLTLDYMERTTGDISRATTPELGAYLVQLRLLPAGAPAAGTHTTDEEHDGGHSDSASSGAADAAGAGRDGAGSESEAGDGAGAGRPQTGGAAAEWPDAAGGRGDVQESGQPAAGGDGPAAGDGMGQGQSAGAGAAAGEPEQGPQPGAGGPSQTRAAGVRGDLHRPGAAAEGGREPAGGRRGRADSRGRATAGR